MSIQFRRDDIYEEQEESYSIEDYKLCRKAIDDIKNQIMKEFVHDNESFDPNREKKICISIIKILANQIRYNYEYCNRIKECTTREEDIINRNLVGGLLHGECVCVGYVEILRNILACFEIESKCVSAYPKESKTDCIMNDEIEDTFFSQVGHAWNQVRLDGKWYNIDLTWDADNITQKYPMLYCFKSDSEFGHDIYAVEQRTEKCDDTLTVIELEDMGYNIDWDSINEITCDQEMWDYISEDEIVENLNEKDESLQRRRLSGQEIGKAGFGIEVEECDKAQKVMEHLIEKYRGRDEI